MGKEETPIPTGTATSLGHDVNRRHHKQLLDSSSVPPVVLRYEKKKPWNGPISDPIIQRSKKFRSGYNRNYPVCKPNLQYAKVGPNLELRYYGLALRNSVCLRKIFHQSNFPSLSSFSSPHNTTRIMMVCGGCNMDP